MKKADFSNMPQALKDAFLRVNPDVQQLKTMHDKDAERMQNFKDVPAELVRSVRASTLIILGDQDIVKPAHAVELTRLISGARLMIVPGGHGDYLGEAVTTQKDTRYPELTARLVADWISGSRRAVVFLMVYVVMPRYTRLIKRWLFTWLAPRSIPEPSVRNVQKDSTGDGFFILPP